MRTSLFILALVVASCSTYRKTDVLRTWRTTYNMVFSVERVSVYDRRTDTLRRSWIDTTVVDYSEWKQRKMMMYFD